MHNFGHGLDHLKGHFNDEDGLDDYGQELLAGEFN